MFPKKEPKNPENESENPEKENWIRQCREILFSKFSRYAFLIVMALIGLRLGINFFISRQIEKALPVVEVAQSKIKKFDQSLNLPGTIEAIQESKLYAHISGYLKTILVDEGDSVKKDQLLAEIDAPDIVQEYRKAKADFDLKEITQVRYRELLKQRVISPQEFDTIKADATDAKARLDNALANLGYMKIRAPFSGAIARRYKYPGDLISASPKSDAEAPLFLLINEDKLRVSINVPQSDSGNISIGQKAEIKIDTLSDQMVDGRVSRIDALIDESSKTERILIDIENPTHKMHSGMFASVTLHLDSHEHGTSIPKQSLHTNEDGTPFVFIVKDNKIKKMPIKLGFSDFDSIEVLSGISSQDFIILRGAESLKDGTKVKISKKQ